MLRDCKEDVVVIEPVFRYNTDAIGGLHMRLCEKIVELRKSNNMSQEQFASSLGVSRQAVSRWEVGSALPDAKNILQISKLFNVTADYLLNDEYVSDNDLPKVKKVKNDNINIIMFYLVVIEIMIMLIQFMCVFILQNVVFAFLSFLLYIAAVGGFEISFRKNESQATEQTLKFRKRFYKISTWLGTYFPVRFLIVMLAAFYPRPYSAIVFEVIVVAVYLFVSMMIDLQIEKTYLND